MANEPIDVNFYPKQLYAMRGYVFDEDLDEHGLGANSIFYGGAAGGGKSFLIRWMSIIFALMVPGLTIYLFRRRYNELISNHLEGQDGYRNILQPFVDAGKVEINMSQMRITFKHPGEKAGSSTITLMHSHREDDVYAVQGAAIDVAIFDEATHMSPKQLRFLLSRVRSSVDIDYSKFKGTSLDFIKPGFFPRVMYCSNPGNISHQYFKSRFVDSAPPLRVFETPVEEGGMRSLFVPARLQDNQALMERDPNYANKLLNMGGALAKQMLEGDWSVADGAIFSDLWDAGIHVVPSLNVTEHHRVYRAMDWGSYHPSAVLWYFISDGTVVEDEAGKEHYFPSGSIIFFHEIYTWNGTENEGNKMSAFDLGRLICETELQYRWGSKVRKGPADNQIYSARGASQLDTVERHLVAGYNHQLDVVAQNWDKDLGSWRKDVLKTKQKASGLFGRADQSHNSRIQGVNAVRMYLSGAKQQEDLRGAYFTENCRHTIRTLPSLPRDSNRPEDIDTSAEDHLADVVKYVCSEHRSSISRLEVSGL